MTDVSEVSFNPFAPGFTDDPYPQYAALRTAVPAYEHALGFWFLSRYSDVQALLRSNASVDLNNLGPGRYRQMTEQLYGEVMTPRLGGLSMLDRDAPDHTRLRKLVTKAFTPRAVAGLESKIRSLVEGKLDAIGRAGRGDVVADLAFPLPFEVISELLGMPETDNDRVRELSGVLARSFEPGVTPDAMCEIVAADTELAEIIAAVVAWKRKHPADDLMSELIVAEDEGDVLSDAELVAQVELIYLAGYHNTVNMIANGVHALLRHPDQLELLRRDSDLIDNAVDELMRFDTPTQFLRRITLEPYRVGDVELAPGSFVLLSIGSANRDETFWGATADTVIVNRENARAHLSFGAGSRFCLGSALARMEARAAIGGLVNRFPKLAADGDVRWNGRINLRGPEFLPISV
ncbi:cytochrome P450 [Nocardia yamanashiensis]|uniref:cytochrome P450 n=1 Tax=Nocardia yamanashiensis TaxID=209247 RepID=UPI00082A5241|nr:cytochrome P450 [Nocardia yamanashiensis]